MYIKNAPTYFGLIKAQIVRSLMMVIKQTYRSIFNVSFNISFKAKLLYINSQRKIQQDATVYQNFVIPYLYEAQHIFGRHASTSCTSNNHPRMKNRRLPVQF
jgi:hypothetical protein